MLVRLQLGALLLVALVVAGCGSTKTVTTTVTRSAPLTAPSVACPQAADGSGTMGACAPSSLVPPTASPPTASRIAPYPDLSNNDPASCSQMKKIAARSKLVYLKVNQGTGFTDQTFRPMLRCARKYGMSVGGYDFVSQYTVAEARHFTALLKQAGLTREAAKTAPPTLDIEYGNATRSGVQQMVNYVKKQFGRVNIYTGNWYWARLGCWWPKGVPAWLAGYPTASPVCGLPSRLYTQHQYADNAFNGAFPSDMNVWRGSQAAFSTFIRERVPSHAAMVWCRRLNAYRHDRYHGKRVSARRTYLANARAKLLAKRHVKCKYGHRATY